jgi:hypothetical protein
MTAHRWGWRAAVLAAFCSLTCLSAQDQARRELHVAPATGPITVDGRLDERDWATAPTAGSTKMRDDLMVQLRVRLLLALHLKYS